MTEERYEYHPHRPMPVKHLGNVTMCICCGLVYLRNDISDWCVKMGCDYRLKPGFKAKLKAAGPFSRAA